MNAKFIWSKNNERLNIMIPESCISMQSRSAERSVYSGYVKFMVPSGPKNTSFHAMLGLTYANKVIPHSNSFLVDKNFTRARSREVQRYMDTAGDDIFFRINSTYDTLVKTADHIRVETMMYLLANPFSARNIGHDISILLDRIKNYRTSRYRMPVVLPASVHECPRSLEICKMLLPTTEFYFVETDKVYHFANLIIPLTHEVFNILKHVDLIEELKAVAASELAGTLDEYTDKKIFLVKNSTHSIVAQSTNMYVCPKTIEHLETKCGYICINAEKTDMNKIICYLARCTKLVASYSGILYGNGIFMNPYCEKFILNRDASDYFTIGSPFEVITVPLNIDSNPNNLLIQIKETRI